MKAEDLQDFSEKKSENWLLVSEIFESHQGEGPSAGRVAKFLRLGGCDKVCHWCDTPYTWVFTERQQVLHRDGKIYDPRHELRRMSLFEIAKELQTRQIEQLVIITGGEPMLQGERVSRLISLMNESLVYRRFEIETAGNIPPGSLLLFENVTFNVSLKLESSGNPVEKRYLIEVIDQFVNARSTFKFVVTTSSWTQDLDEIEKIARSCGIAPDRIWLMPEGITQLDQVSGTQLLMPEALKRGYNFTSRLHVLAYGNERGI